jgi:uncharacterized protein YcaQ
MELTQSEARKLFLKQQGLLRDNEFGRGKNATNRVIQRLSYVQIDTISVIRRAHEHVLYNRVGNYSPKHLEKLVQEREIFEYWSHAAAFLPFKDFRYSLPVMKGFRNARQCDNKIKSEVLARIQAEGLLQSRDFAGYQKQETCWLVGMETLKTGFGTSVFLWRTDDDPARRLPKSI